MSKRVLVPALLLGSLIALGAAGRADALCVNPGGTSGCYSSIQEAVNHAVTGDIILIAAGRYREAVTIGVTGLKLVGPLSSAGKAIVDPYNAGSVDAIDVNADNVIIRRLFVQNSQANGIVIVGNNATLVGVNISGVATTGTPDGALVIQGDGATVDSSAITRAQGNCVYVQGNNVTISNTVVRQCASDAIDITGNSAKVLDSTVADAEDGGIIISGDNLEVRRNNVTNIDDYGIEVAGAAPILTKNVVVATFDPAFDIDCTSGCGTSVVDSNTAQNVTDDDGFELNAAVGGMTVSNNKAIRAMFSGFDLASGSQGITLTGNQATACGYNNVHYGFDIAGTGHTLTNNVASANHGSGFRLCNTTTVTLGPGNTATGNYMSGIELSPSLCTNTDAVLTGNTVTNNARNGIVIEPSATDTEVEESAGSGNRVDYCDTGTGTVFGTGNTFGTSGGPHCIY